MEDLYNSIMQQQVDAGLLIGALVVSLIVSFFHYMIFTGLYKINLGKYFFAVYPLLLVVLYFIQPQFMLIGIGSLFVLTFPMAFLGIVIIAPVLGIRERVNYQNKQQELARITNKNAQYLKPAKKKNWIWELLKSLFFIACFFGSFAVLGFFGPILLIVLTAVISKKRSGSSLMKLQKSLPTSKIRSVAMGLAEIQGKIVIDEALTSRVKSKRCAGYYYLIQEISHDDDGKEQLSTIHTDFLYNPFFLEDETGRIKVIPDKLQLLHFNEYSYRSNGKKYTEYVLEEDDKLYLMIGKASRENNEPVFAYDENKRILSITPTTAVEKHDQAMYYLAKARPYIIAFLLWAAFILSSDIRVSSSGVSVSPHRYLNKNFGIFKNNKSEKEEQVTNENSDEAIYAEPVEN